jgi:hypothetical protein
MDKNSVNSTTNGALEWIERMKEIGNIHCDDVLKLNAQQQKYINNINDERARLTEEIARYKQEAEKIPDICYKYRHDPDECVPNNECPKICPRFTKEC